MEKTEVFVAIMAAFGIKEKDTKKPKKQNKIDKFFNEMVAFNECKSQTGEIKGFLNKYLQKFDSEDSGFTTMEVSE